MITLLAVLLLSPHPLDTRPVSLACRQGLCTVTVLGRPITPAQCRSSVLSYRGTFYKLYRCNGRRALAFIPEVL